MTPPVRRSGADLRLLRAAVFTAVCVALSAGGHVLASAGSVPLWTLGAAALPVLAVAFAAAGRERSLPAIGSLLAVGQLGLHGLFVAGQHSVAGQHEGSTSGAMALARRLLCGDGRATLTEGRARRLVLDAGIDPDRLAPVADAVRHAGHAGHGALDTTGALSAVYAPSMLIGHLLAALAAGWLLRRGEAALFRLTGLAAGAGAPARALRSALRLATALRSGLRYAGGVRRTSRPVRTAAPPRDPSVVLAHSVHRRGPPAWGLAA
ncbi:hypothetical protein ACFQLX_07450 [Streptomyces polyrhachis]|uniref:Integral membrane protein n=1 Tax=Streptomyces polyrhachis TaxID=1282885 RepID=A0ABW2GF27_9ACTN